MLFLCDGNFSNFYHFFVFLKNGVIFEMVILVFFNSFNMVKNLKKPDLVARQKPPFYTTVSLANISILRTEAHFPSYYSNKSLINPFYITNLRYSKLSALRTKFSLPPTPNTSI